MSQFDLDKVEKIDAWFYLKDKEFAQRFTSLVPQIGDEVRFNGVAYKVIYRIWIYDEKFPRVAMTIQEVIET